MKNLIPLMVLLVVGGTFTAPASMAANGSKCEEGDSCCKEGGGKKGVKKAKTSAKSNKGAETKAETK